MKENGLYIIKDQFFSDVNDPYLSDNKHGSRPHYYCFPDKDGIYWMIPLSSKVDKYKRIIQKREESGKKCYTLYIAKTDDSRESAFLLQNMFPVTEEYIEREYTIAGNHLTVTSEKTAQEINRKAKRVASMLKHGTKFFDTQPDINAILDFLKPESSETQEGESSETSSST